MCCQYEHSVWVLKSKKKKPEQKTKTRKKNKPRQNKKREQNEMKQNKNQTLGLGPFHMLKVGKHQGMNARLLKGQYKVIQ